MSNKLEELVKKFKGSYTLPGAGTQSVQVIPVSGGGDSTAMAILMKALFPEIDFKYVMTDTGVEDEEIYVSLDALEKYLGKSIDRVSDGKTLYEVIEEYGGFLPSPKDRYCTRITKLKPFQKWIEKYEGIQKFMYIGIRADESSRLAFTIDEVSTEMPFVDLGLTRKDVFQILNETIGIPRYYSRRSRSGCECCPYQQRAERVGLLQEKPVQFHRAMSYEKISKADHDRHTTPVSLVEETGVALNWMTLPMPTDGDITGKIRRNTGKGLFQTTGIFIGAEIFFDGMYGESFIWRQNIVSYSPTLAGLKKQLDGRYRHLLSTYEVLHIESEKELKSSLRFAIYYIQADENVFDPKGPSGEKVYTWHQGESYLQMKHIISWARRILHAEGMKQEAAKYSKASEISWEGEQFILTTKAIDKISEEVGDVVNSMWYVPTEPKENDPEELDERNVACPMCQI